MKRLYPGILAVMLLAWMAGAAPGGALSILPPSPIPRSSMTGSYGINDLGEIVGEDFVPGDLYPQRVYLRKRKIYSIQYPRCHRHYPERLQ